MELKKYKSFCVCPSCGNTIPRNRKFFRRNSNGYHAVCKQCEDVYKKMSEWKDGMLLCHSCHEYKPETEFTPNNTKNELRHFRRHICKTCSAERQRKHDLELDNNAKLSKCLRFRFLGARDRATKANTPFNISLEYLAELWNKQSGRCALSDIDMTFELKRGRTPTNISIDRIDQSCGYVTGNVQLVCMACNQIKSDMSEDEMYSFCKAIVEHYENKNN